MYFMAAILKFQNGGHVGISANVNIVFQIPHAKTFPKMHRFDSERKNIVNLTTCDCQIIVGISTYDITGTNRSHFSMILNRETCETSSYSHSVWSFQSLVTVLLLAFIYHFMYRQLAHSTL